MRLFAVPAVLVLAGLVLADETFTEKDTVTLTYVLKANLTNKSARTTVVSIKGKKVKMAETDPNSGKVIHIFIYDAEKNVGKDISPDNKTYAERTPEQFAKRIEDATKKAADLEAKLDKVAPDRKEMVEGYIWRTKNVLGLLKEAPKVELSKTGEKQKIGEYDCERVVIKEANAKGEMQVVFDVWMTEKIGGFSAYVDFFAAFKTFSAGVLEKMRELKGFHVKGSFIPYYCEKDPFTELNEFDNSDVKEGDLKAEDFEVPADYKNTSKK